jgi:hypothetical protein
MTAYGCGLRLAEVLALRPEHVDEGAWSSASSAAREERPLRQAPTAPARDPAEVPAGLPAHDVALRGTGEGPAAVAEDPPDRLPPGAPPRGHRQGGGPPLPPPLVRHGAAGGR